MSEEKTGRVEYPKTPRIQWTRAHTGMIGLAFLIWPTYWYFNPSYCVACWPKLLAVAGLFLNTVGATIATLKPPFYGIFHDGGKLQRDCEELAGKYFKFGMVIVAVGFVLQAIKEIL